VVTSEIEGDEAAHFDHWDPQFTRDPYPKYRELRQACPVAHSDVYGGFWIASDYESVVDVCHRPEEFSSKHLGIPEETGAGDMVLPPINVDPPEHGPFKRLLSPAFNPSQVAALEPAVREMAKGLLKGLRGQECIDGSADFAKPLPILVTEKMLGTPAEDSSRFGQWVGQIVEGGTDQESVAVATLELAGYLNTLMEERAREPRDDLISFIVGADADIDWQARLGCCFVLLIAGIDTTWSTLGSIIWHLARTSADWEALAARPELLPSAIEEFVRVFAPTTVARTATRDTVIGDQRICVGDRVLVPFPSANRDEHQFPEPDSVLLDRQPNRHVGFGIGIHRCLGSGVARMELRVALEELLGAVRTMSLVDEGAVQWKGGPVRGASSVPVRVVWQ
jgi:hypothetical protein